MGRKWKRDTEISVVEGFALKNECYYATFDRKENLHFDSRTVHGALGCDPISGSISFPIFQSSTFRHREFGVSTGYDYTRTQNPTRQELERTVAMLESGAEAFAFSSGQAANMAVFQWLPADSDVLISSDVYGGTVRIGDIIFSKQNIRFHYMDLSDLDAVRRAMTPKTRMIFAETPTNPTMMVADIRALAEIAHENGAILVIDNTFMTPFFQRPLELGADLAVHSGTKYLAGHNDTCAGLVVAKDEALAPFFREMVQSQGACLAPMDSWLVLRGIKTLALRMERHAANAKAVAGWLRTQPHVTKVYYAGFEDRADYALSRRQCSGFSGMVSFEVDTVETAQKVLSDVKMILFAESLGGVESLITYPLTQTHCYIPEAKRLALGINERFLRLSVGIENVEDIIADLDQALNG